MACRYTYKGKTYEVHEFDDVLRAMAPAEAAAFMPNVQSMPIAPFVDSTDKWLALALKRVIKMAVDGGYEAVAFVNGDQSAERYDLSKQVDRIEALPGRDYAKGVYDLDVWPKDGAKIVKHGLSAGEVEGLVGKEMASKIVRAVDALREKHLAYRAELAKTGVPESRLDVLRAERDAIETDFSGLTSK